MPDRQAELQIRLTVSGSRYRGAGGTFIHPLSSREGQLVYVQAALLVYKLADTASEILEVKHAYQQDIEPQPGIDY